MRLDGRLGNRKDRGNNLVGLSCCYLAQYLDLPVAEFVFRKMVGKLVIAGDDSTAKDSSESGSGDAKARRAGASDDDKTTRLWLIPVAGGEAQPLYREKLDAHTFAWSPDSKTIYLSTTTPLTHAQEDAQKDDWKDVIRWREQERPELLLALPVAVSLANTAAQQQPHPPKEDKTKQDETKLTLPAGAQNLATLKLEIAEIAPAPDGKTVAFLTTAISHRMENPGDTEIFLLPATGGEPHQLTHNLALEAGLRWTSDSHWGLTGMRERAQAIRAEFNIWSCEGTGTEVELVIPASISYPRKQKSAAKQQVVSQ